MKLFIQESAEQDILRQVEWYAEQGLPDVARRFSAASVEAIETLILTPEAGPPRHTANTELTGLRTWGVKGFDEFRVYYIVRADLLIVVRVLHSKQDTGTILAQQDVANPDRH